MVVQGCWVPGGWKEGAIARNKGCISGVAIWNLHVHRMRFVGLSRFLYVHRDFMHVGGRQVAFCVYCLPQLGVCYLFNHIAVTFRKQ